MKPLLALLIFAVAGCSLIADNEVRQHVLWLQKAGFRTASHVPAGAVEPAGSRFSEKLRPDGSRAFYFPDPLTGAVYVGGEREMAAYREIAVRARARRAANLARITPGESRVNGPMVW